jgi:hypothetical protein
MRKFNVISKEYFELFLKECEWRSKTPNPKRHLMHLTQWAKKNMRWLSRTVSKVTGPDVLSKAGHSHIN